MTLKVKALSAIRWTSFSAIFKALISFLQIAILARILVPSDFGLIAIATATISFASIFADFGLNSAFVQKINVTNHEKSSIFWASIISGCLIASILASLSSLIALLLAEDRLAKLILLSSLTIVIGSLASTIKSSAEKSLLFKSIVLVEICSSLIGLSVAVYSALNGQGVYSMIYGAISSVSVNTLLVWFYLRGQWLPSLRFSFNDIKAFYHFGGAFLLSNLINYLNSTLDLFLGTRLLGTSALGLYSVPRNLILQIQFMINPIITRVGFPLLASIQNDAPRLKKIYLTSLNMTTSFNAIIYVGIAFFSSEICSLLLGNQWLQSSQILAVLALWGLIRATLNPVGILINSTGHALLGLKWNICLLFFYLPAILLGAKYGIQGIAFSMLSVISLLFVPAWYFLVKNLCQATFGEYIQVTIWPCVICVISFGVAKLTSQSIDFTFLRLLAGVIIGTALYLCLSTYTNKNWILAVVELVGLKK